MAQLANVTITNPTAIALETPAVRRGFRGRSVFQPMFRFVRPASDNPRNCSGFDGWLKLS
jgi:hypothetical protein